jgi:hypothetical protein
MATAAAEPARKAREMNFMVVVVVFLEGGFGDITAV